MKRFASPLFYRLYVRLWLAVVAAILLSMALIMVAWHWSAERQGAARVRELAVLNAQGEQVGTAFITPPRLPGHGAEVTLRFNREIAPTESLSAQLPLRRPRSDMPNRDVTRWGDAFGANAGQPGGDASHNESDLRRRPPSPLPAWLTPPFGFLWWVLLAGLAVAAAAYPVMRRLTSRLNALEEGVQKWGKGELSLRLPVQGHDEVASLTERFNTAAEQIEQLLVAHKALLANASHELRSPLARMRMALGLMNNETHIDGERHLKDEINRSISELDQLVEEILLASRLNASPAEWEPLEMVDLTGLVAEEVVHHNALLQAEAVWVQGSGKLLRRLVRNLLDNANKYARPDTGSEKEKPQVLLTLMSTQRNGQRLAVIQIDDNGPGVPLPERERIFEPFYRVHGASEKDGGVGLGLALVKSIAKRHGGSVRCEAAPGGGARFVVELAQVDAPA